MEFDSIWHYLAPFGSLQVHLALFALLVLVTSRTPVSLFPLLTAVDCEQCKPKGLLRPGIFCFAAHRRHLAVPIMRSLDLDGTPLEQLPTASLRDLAAHLHNLQARRRRKRRRATAIFIKNSKIHLLRNSECMQNTDYACVATHRQKPARGFYTDVSYWIPCCEKIHLDH